MNNRMKRAIIAVGLILAATMFSAIAGLLAVVLAAGTGTVVMYAAGTFVAVTTTGLALINFVDKPASP